MIKYSLVCKDGHAFESWFASGMAYEEQNGRGFVECPVCRSSQVSKAIMAPAIASHLGSVVEHDILPPQPIMPIPVPPALLDPQNREMREVMGAIRTQILADTVDVGKSFPEEARKMHDGEIPERPIRGEASAEEAHALIQDGVKIVPVPMAPEDLN
jgi:hypothetical protein